MKCLGIFYKSIHRIFTEFIIDDILQYNIHLRQYCCLSQTGLEAPEDPGDAIHLVVGEPLQLGVHADDRVRGR